MGIEDEPVDIPQIMKERLFKIAKATVTSFNTSKSKINIKIDQ